MDWSVLFGAVGMLSGFGGLIVAIRSNSFAKGANRQAEIANETARESLDVAHEANSLVEDANKLAEDANAISKRALAATTDNLIYNWDIKVEDSSQSAIVINACPHAALNVSVLATAHSRAVAESRQDNVASFGELTLDLSGLFEQHLNEVRNNPSRPASSEGGIFFTGSKGKTITTTLTFHISWQTPDGIARDTVVEYKLRHFDDHGTIRRRN